jgi:hypothetical protein
VLAESLTEELVLAAEEQENIEAAAAAELLLEEHQVQGTLQNRIRVRCNRHTKFVSEHTIVNTLMVGRRRKVLPFVCWCRQTSTSTATAVIIVLQPNTQYYTSQICEMKKGLTSVR